jgi:hypothetical protein
MAGSFHLGILLTLMVASATAAMAQSAPNAEKLGKVHFETSCNASVGQEFDHAMAARTYYQQLVKIRKRGERQRRKELDRAATYLGGTR